MNKLILKQIALQVLGILLFFGLTYFWVEEKDLAKSIHTTVIYIIIFSVIHLVRYVIRKRQI